MEYRVLTLWQPWASLLVHRVKKIETRPAPTSWTKEKGIYLIHAASKWTKEQSSTCRYEPFYAELKKLGFVWSGYVDKFPLGQIIGAIEVTECCPIYSYFNGATHSYCSFKKGKPEFIKISQPEVSFGHYDNGRYAWLCENPRLLKEPIPYKGGQGYYQRFKGDKSKLIFA